MALLDVAVYEHGLPVVWVPRSDLLDKVLSAEGRAARVAVLTARLGEVLDDCEAVLHEVAQEGLAMQKPLALAAVRALREGHPEAAQALAVAVADTAIQRFLHVQGGYQKIKDHVFVDLDETAIVQFRQAVAFAPIYVFLTTWYADSSHPVPEALSRHVTIHQAQTDHLHEGNAVVAVMLMASLLRAFDETLRLSAAP